MVDWTTCWAFTVHAPGSSIFLIIFRKDKIIILLSDTRTIPIIIWHCDGCWSSRIAVCYWKMLSCHLLLTSPPGLPGKQPIIHTTYQQLSASDANEFIRVDKEGIAMAPPLLLFCFPTQQQRRRRSSGKRLVFPNIVFSAEWLAGCWHWAGWPL